MHLVWSSPKPFLPSTLDSRLHKRTASLWDYILEKTHLFVDPLYDPSSSDFLLPNTDMRRLK